MLHTTKYRPLRCAGDVEARGERFRPSRRDGGHTHGRRRIGNVSTEFPEEDGSGSGGRGGGGGRPDDPAGDGECGRWRAGGRSERTADGVREGRLDGDRRGDVGHEGVRGEGYGPRLPPRDVHEGVRAVSSHREAPTISKDPVA